MRKFETCIYKNEEREKTTEWNGLKMAGMHKTNACDLDVGDSKMFDWRI